MIKSLVRVKVEILVAALQVAVPQIMTSYSYTYGKQGWLSRRWSRLIQWLGDIIWHVTSVHWGIVLRKLGMVVVWRFKDRPSTSTNQFQSVFWSFDPSTKGFQSCRSIISIDGTHLYNNMVGWCCLPLGLMLMVSCFLLRSSSWKARTTTARVGSWLV